MTPAETKAWTFDAAARAIAFVRALPTGEVERVLGRQLLRSATSVAAHYRAACRAQSRRDFLSKMKRLEEEADESLLWLELVRTTGLTPRLRQDAARLEDDYSRLTAIAVSSAKTVRARLARRMPSKPQAG